MSVAIPRLSLGFLRLSFGYPLGYPSAVTWLSLGYPSAIPWAIPWLPVGYPLAILSSIARPKPHIARRQFKDCHSVWTELSRTVARCPAELAAQARLRTGRDVCRSIEGCAR